MFKPLENNKSQELSYGDCDFVRSYLCFTPQSKSRPTAVLCFSLLTPLDSSTKFRRLW